MVDSPQLQRALVLHAQGRHDMVEKELRQVLAQNPENAFALALLAISLAELERRDEAEASAREAIGKGPDLPFAHYAMARVMMERQRPDDAAAAIAEAIRLEPDAADYHATNAAIQFQKEQWQAALQAAETGLQTDPEHVGCNNLRAMALVKLGRKSEAGASLDTTLSREPENSITHANKGWTLLEQGRRKEALVHFKESLRLEPGGEWAREGLIEALKAGNPIYAIVLRYFLWMRKLSPRARWSIVIGGFLGSRILSGMSASNPDLAPWILPVRALYISFALLTWLAVPIFNLFLFVHPLGRYALDKRQRLQATLVGACLAAALLLAVAALQPAFKDDDMLAAMIMGLMAIPVSAVFACPEGWPRNTMAAIAGVLALVGCTATALLALVHPVPKSDLEAIAALLGTGFFIGVFISMWVANYLVSQRPTR